MTTEFEFDVDAGEEKDEEEGGWQWGGRNAIIFLIDASAGMFEVVPHAEDEDSNQGLSFLLKAFKCVHASMCQNIITNDQDLIGVVLFNTKEMKNSISFSNIYVLQDLERPGAEKIMQLEKMLEDSESKEFKKKFGFHKAAAIADALWVCSSLFNDCNTKLLWKSVLLFTCIDDPHHGEEQKQRQARAKARDLKEAGVDLELLHIGKSFNASVFYKDLLEQDDDLSTAHSATLQPSIGFRELFDRVHKFERKQRTTARTTFSLGKNLAMGVKVYTSVRKAYKPSKIKLCKRTNEEVRTQRKEYLEETGELLLPSDYVKYQQYGGKTIKFTVDEVKTLSKVYEPGIALLGFRPAKDIHPYLYVKPASIIYPDEENYRGSTKVFSCLLHRCMAKEVVPIVRMIPRFGASTAWAALLPCMGEDEEGNMVNPLGFTVAYLPFADDFRSVEVNKRPRANTDQVDAAKEVIKKLNFRYFPYLFENPDIQTHWRNIKALALNRSYLEDVVDYTVPDYKRIQKKAGYLTDALKSLVYPEDYDPTQKPKPKKRPPPSNSLSEPKRTKADGAASVEDMAKSKKVDKLTVDALKMWLQERGIRVTGKKKAQLVQDVYDELHIL